MRQMTYDDLYIPQPRFADTQELDLQDLLSTEAQDAYETAQLTAVHEWLREGGN